jgi:hypothetical protein
MEKYPKTTVMTKNGTSVRMNDAALKIAERHFGVTRQHGFAREVPPEILQLPKRIDIIKAVVKVQPPTVEVDEKAIEHDIAMDVIKKTRKAPVRSKSK